MIVKQLNELYDINNVFVYNSILFELLGDEFKHKYRVILHSDDYDYIEDEEFIKELDARVIMIAEEIL